MGNSLGWNIEPVACHGRFVKSPEASTVSARSSWLDGTGSRARMGGQGAGGSEYPVTSRLAEVITGDRNRHQICKRKCLWPVEYVTWYTLKS